MGKTLTANFTTEKDKAAGAQPRTLLEIDTASGTLFYSDQALTVSAQAYTANVISWPSRIRSQIQPGEEVIRTSSASFVINNNPRIDDDIRPGLEVRLYLWFEGLTTADKLLWFKGIINEEIEITAYRVSFVATDIGDWFDKQIGIPLDTATFPNADPDDIGKIQPILYGDLTDQPCLAIVAGAVSTLVNDISIGVSSIELTDASAFPSSGTLIIGDEEDITYSGKSTNTLTGVANVSNAYARASRVMEKIAQLEYMVAGHAVKAITNPRILPTGFKVEDAVRIDSGDFTANIDDSGIATVDITNIANVKKAVEVSVTTQPNQPVTTQQTQVSDPHGHTPSNQTVPYHFDSVPISPGTHANIGRLVNTELVDEASASFTDNLLFKVQKSLIEELEGTPVSAILKMNAREAAGLVGKVNMKFVLNGVTKIDEQKSLDNTLTTYSTSSFSLSGADWSDFQNANTYIELKRTDGIGGSITIFFGETWLELIYTPSNPTTAVTVNESVAAVSNRIVDAVVGGNSVADTLGGILIVDAEGYPDDNPAHYTDVADSLTEEPWDVIHHILENHGNGVTDSDIDLAGSFQDAEDNLPASYKFAFSIRQKINMNRLLALLSQQTWCRFIWEAGIAKLNRIKLTGTSTKSIDTDTDSYVSSDRRLQVRKQIKGLSEIYNDIEVKYNLNYTLGSWATPDAFEGSSEDTNSNSITKYKTRQRTWLMFAIGDNSSMADDVRNKLLDFYREARPIVSFPAWLKHVELERGDIVGLTTTQLGIVARNYEIIGVDLQVPHPVNRQRPELVFSLLDTLSFEEILSFTMAATVSETDIQEYKESLSVTASATISETDFQTFNEELLITASATISETNTITTDTPWCGSEANKLYLQSGTFSSTLKTSAPVGVIETNPQGISWDGTNTPFCGLSSIKLYLVSGQFTFTLKDSEDVSGVDTQPDSISSDGTNTPWIGGQANKLYLQSGQFTSTIKTSQSISGVDTAPSGISYDGTNTPWAGTQDNKLYLQSGQFTSTIKDSEDISGVDTGITDISYNGVDTPWIGQEAKKLYLQSGQFTDTLKTSEDIIGVDNNPRGIETNSIGGRLGI